jgi:hypothetical protein
MSKAQTESVSMLFESSLVALHGFYSRVEPMLLRRCRGWSLVALDKLITGASIVLLAPAIFAVLIAIRRSAPQKSRTINEAAPSPASRMRIPISPVLAGVGEFGALKVVAKRAVSA